MEGGSEFTEIRRSGGEQAIISVNIGGREGRSSEREGRESRATLEVTEQDGVKDGSKDLV